MAQENLDLRESNMQAGMLMRRRGRKIDSELDITPMIDITFLLLIFFIVAARIDQSGPNLPWADHAKPTPAENAVVITATVGDDGVARLYLGETTSEEVTGDDEEKRRKIADYIVAGFLGRPPFDRPAKSVMLKSDGEVKQGVNAVYYGAIPIAQRELDTLSGSHVAVRNEKSN